jgi:cytochrome d ubiquinol oxidase subunit I
MEGLLAFFLESTFLGLWIFGWDRLPEAAPGHHLAGRRRHRCSRPTSSSPPTPSCSTRWATSSTRSPAAPSSPTSVAVLTTRSPHGSPSRTPLPVVPHRVRCRRRRGERLDDHPPRTVTSTCSAPPPSSAPSSSSPPSSCPSAATSGHEVMVEVQPMKMAAAEALYTTHRRAVQHPVIGTLRTAARRRSSRSRTAVLARHGQPRRRREVQGINDLQAQYAEPSTAPDELRAQHPVTYWTFRLMIGIGMIGALIAVSCCGPSAGRAPRRAGSRPLGRIIVLFPLLGTASAGSSPRWAASPGSSSG